MASFADLSANLKLNIQNFSHGLRSAARDARRFARNLNGEISTPLNQINKHTKAWGLNMKSVSRVVSGIIISQAFYRILQSVQGATNAVWEFSKQLEYANIAYSNLFGNASLASEFINVLKDFAAKTPFSFTEAEAAAKRLLAYGIQYKNVMYVLQGVLSAASIQGDSAKIEAISRAFGQIYTYGKLMTQEVRQLSEAGIPAYEILREELGLTQEQLANLGHEGIPAAQAINALVDGIQKRFGSATEAAALTITGIISNIKDNATMLFASMFEPLTRFIKSGLAALGSFLFRLREIQEASGLGGVFEALVPEEAQATLRQFIANLAQVGLAAMRVVYALGGLLKPVLQALVAVFNAFAPVLTFVFNLLASAIKTITENARAMRILSAAIAAAAAMWVIYKARALAAAAAAVAIKAISVALAGMATMLNFVVAHPFWALMIGLGGVLLGLSVGFSNIGNKVNSFFKKLTQIGGVDPDKVLLPSQKERANDLDKFNNKLDGTSDAMDDLADSTGKATKAAKGLLSFDEVFKLNEPDEGASGIDTDDLTDLIDTIGGIGGDSFMPEVPDFSDYMDAFTGGFLDGYKEAWDGIKDEVAGIASTAIGAAFGGLVGRLLGGKLGGIFGAVAGAIVGYFWDKVAEHFGLDPDQKVNAGIIGGVGAIIGAILGGLIGGPAGAKIGLAIGGLVGSFWGILAEALGIAPEQHIATVLSGALTGAIQAGLSLFKSLVTNLAPVFIDDAFAGFARNLGFSFKAAISGALKQGAIGAIASLVAGGLANALTAWIAGELELTEQDLANSGVGQTIGNIVGSIIGFVLGGPIGSIVGGALGQLAGSVVGEFWAYLSTTLKGAVIGGAAGAPIGAVVGALVGSIGGPLGTALGAAIGVALGALVGLIVEYWQPIADFFVNAWNVVREAFVSAGQFIVDTWNTVTGAFTAAGQFIVDTWNTVTTAISNFFTSIWNAVTEFFMPIGQAISDVCNTIWTIVSTIWNDVVNVVTTVCKDIWSAVTTVWNDVVSAITTVCNAIWGVVSEIWYLVRDLVVKVATDIWNAVVNFFSPIFEEIARVCNNIWNVVVNVWNAIVNFFTKAVNAIWNAVVTAFNNIVKSVTTFLTNLFNGIKNAFNAIVDFVKAAATSVFNAVVNAFRNLLTTASSIVSNIAKAVKNAFLSIHDGVSGTVSNLYSTVKSGISRIYTTFTNWVSKLWDNVFGKFFGWISDGIEKLREFFGLESRASKSSTSYSSSSSKGSSSYGHATGGIFNREHVARFAEGNKAEAIIPLEEESAMRPFVDAVANGLTASLAPIIANINSGSDRQPLYVGTLIADDRSLRELERKMEIIRLQENRR